MQQEGEHTQAALPSQQLFKNALTIIIIIAVFLSGLYIGRTNRFFGQDLALDKVFPTAREAAGAQDVNLDEFWAVWKLLDEKFVSASTTKSLTLEDKVQGAIAGLVSAYGDPYTVYLPPSEAERFGDDISGNFSGVGMEVGLRDGVVTIISPLPGTPAEKAGLISGDIIVKIDGKSTEDMRVDEAVRMIRGEKGTTVTFEIFREGDKDFRTIPVVRDTIDIPTVKTEKVDDVFIIALYSFNAISESKMEEAVKEYQASGSKKLIIDLRGNPGGFMQSAVDIASFFMPQGKVVVREQSGKGEEDIVFRTRSRQVGEFTPENLIVLVDNGSASASEILAGALKDHGVATVIGVPTFGKGSVQELMDLDGGASLKVTIARWLTPNGVSISDGGLAPDIVIKRTPADREAGKDPQKDAALRFLKGETVVSEDFANAVTEPSGE
jgi:carboxyl-terminal processing protease